MKFFEEQKVVKKEEKRPEVDSSQFVKNNLMLSVNRSDEIRNLVKEWLFSFEGALTKDAFLHQIKRLDWDDEVAKQQLANSRGRRVIQLPKAKEPPLLTKGLVETMLEDGFVAVTGRKFRPAVKDALAQLKDCGKVYVLQVERLILEFKDYEHKGNAPQMIDDAIEADFLFVADLEIPIHIEWHVHEAISRIGRMRKKAGKPIISTWNRFNDVNDYFEDFKIYTIR